MNFLFKNPNLSSNTVILDSAMARFVAKFLVAGPKLGYSGGLCQGTGSQHKAVLEFYDMDQRVTIIKFTL